MQFEFLFQIGSIKSRGDTLPAHLLPQVSIPNWFD